MTRSNSFVSVIIPVYNDPKGLRTTVKSLRDQTVDNYEIIIADNGSTDETEAISENYSQVPGILRVVEDDIQGSYAARNAGIDSANGEILAFIDADMWVESDWLEKIQLKFREAEISYIGSDVEIISKEDTLASKYNQRNGFRIEYYLKEKNFAPTCCLVCRKELFDEVGNFDPRLISSGDVEFGLRVQKAGYSQEFAPDITMYHPARESVSDLVKKQFRIGRGNIQRVRYHPDKFDKRHPLNPRGFLPVRPSNTYDYEDPVRLKVGFFTIAYMLKLSNTAGRITEWVRPTKE